MVLKGYLSRVFYLIYTHLKELGKSSGSHRACCTNLCLTSAFCTADGCIRLYYSTHETCDSKRLKNFFIGEIMLSLHI